MTGWMKDGLGSLTFYGAPYCLYLQFYKLLPYCKQSWIHHYSVSYTISHWFRDLSNLNGREWKLVILLSIPKTHWFFSPVLGHREHRTLFSEAATLFLLSHNSEIHSCHMLWAFCVPETIQGAGNTHVLSHSIWTTTLQMDVINPTLHIKDQCSVKLSSVSKNIIFISQLLKMVSPTLNYCSMTLGFGRCVFKP
jgi:hypothetical protein